jgi:hypothetical protein
MKLNALSGGDAQGVVAVLRRQIIEHAPLLRRHHPARDATADHHDVLLASLAQIAVILLVRTMKLEKLIVVVREMIRRLIRNGRGNST